MENVCLRQQIKRLPMADNIEIEIDGKKLTAKPNQTVIQVADEAGIYIPRFCYHQLLSIPANCRMCLVEIEKAPKTLPACSTPVMPGMKVFTKSEKTLKSQRAVMEFLLINHPLDCPICDQGGECELQDLSMGYGSSDSEYTESKRSVADQNLGPLISTEMTRCIYCTRCVRFGDEIAGMRELGLVGRGEFTEVGTYIQHVIKSEVSGNIIDLCPVGALTSKPFRFTARAWELNQAPSIAPHDCIGSNIKVHTRYGKVMRVVAGENFAINETWLSDRDRFSYTGLYHHDRIEQPMARINGVWKTVSWQKAFEIVASGLQSTIAASGANQIGALASPSATVEELYLLQKIMRGLGSPHIDHRLRQVDTQDQDEMPAYPGLSIGLEALEQCDAILLIGSNVQKEQPIAALRIRKATLKGTAVVAVNPVDYLFNFKLAAKKIIAPDRMADALADIAKALEPASDGKSDAVVEQIVQQLRGKQNVCVLLGALAMNHPHAAELRYFAQNIAKQTGGTFGILSEGANAAGAWLSGAVPHRGPAGQPAAKGMNAYEMLADPRKGYVLLNVEPDLDCANTAEAIAALERAAFILALSIYRNPVIEAYAHVILPITPFTETAGTFVNAMGEWQSFKGVAKPLGEARPAWKILRVLGNFLHLDGFSYEDSEEVKHEIKKLVDEMPAVDKSPKRPQYDKTAKPHSLARIGEIPIYAIDSLVRRAEPLQDTQVFMEGETACVRLHPKQAEKLGVQDKEVVCVKQQENEVQLPVLFDTRMPPRAALIAGGIWETSELGDLFGEVVIEKC